MANAEDRQAVLFENLCDAGLCAESAEHCLHLLRTADLAALNRILSEHRKLLLDRVHLYTDQLDRLDYFTYNLRKNGGTKP